MKPTIFEKTSIVSAPIEKVFAWHKRRFAFQRIMPHWENTTCEIESHEFKNDTVCGFSFKIGPIKFNWKARYRDVVENRQFVDVQENGPFKQWVHTHLFESQGPNQTKVIDHVEYILPMGYLGKWVAGGYAHRRLVNMFHRRHSVLAQEFSKPEDAPQKILISGASGLIGSALVPLLTTKGHDVYTLVRKKTGLSRYEIYWNPERGEIDASKLEGFDAVIHLAGESVMGRWTATKKRAILESRQKGTQLLVDHFKNKSLKSFISASAIGYYGAAETTQTEESPAGHGFLSSVCQTWEAISKELQSAKTRTVQIRIGIVLSPKGGALKQILPPFKLGFGGPMGHGQQFMSWISIDDLVNMFHEALINEKMSGPINGVSRAPISNLAFSKTLAKVLKRPCLIPLPAFAIKAIFGELGEELLLSSLKVVPQQAERLGFKFMHATLEEALIDLLGLHT